MDDRSTPINSLNNSSDDSEVVNNILSKYNNIQQDSASGTLPPLNRNIPQMENKFENRNLNNELYNLKGGNNVEYEKHYQNEQKRVAQYNKEDQQYEEESCSSSEEDYDEYEVIEIPLWKRILNELRIPLFILIIVVLFSNCYFDKFLITKIPIMGNQFNDCNTYGFIFKAILISLLSYLLIRFIRV